MRTLVRPSSTPQTPGLYTVDQVIGMFVEALDSLREELARPQRDRAIQKLGALLLEFDPTSPRKSHDQEAAP